MGLDIYVGTFRRYYGGEWQTIVQQVAAANGIPVQVIRPGEPRRGLFARVMDRLRPKPDTGSLIEGWRAELAGVAGMPLDWNEEPGADYFTDKPAWDGYGAVLVWAAYEEHGVPEKPATAEAWEKDPLVIASMENPGSRYRHLLRNTEIWLPVDFDDPFEGPLLTGQPVVYGSSLRLAAELAALNAATWRADTETLSRWRHEGAEYHAPLDESARFGFGLLYELTALAVQHRLPMKLDY